MRPAPAPLTVAPVSSSPFLALGAEIPWSSLDVAEVVPAIDALLVRARSEVAAIGASEADDYARVLGALEHALEPLSRAMAVLSHLEGVASTPALREAYGAVHPKVAEFYGSLPLDPALYARLVAVERREAEARTLDPVRRRHLDKTIADFRRHGAELDEAGKRRLAEIDVALAQVTHRFSNHVLDATNAFELLVEDEAKLAGLPASARQLARAAAEAKGKPGWRFTLQAPSVMGVLTYLDDAAIRRAVWEAYNRRAAEAPHDNAPLVVEILALRAEKAKLLGKADFADLVLEDRMAQRGAKAEAFLQDLAERTRAAFAAETEELRAFRRELEGPDAPPLAPWDVGYYAEKLRAARFEFDEEELRPYFADERVLRGLFEIAGRLYGVRFEEKPETTWDPAVRTFAMFDGERALGHFYVDLYPRENKRAGAWMASLLTAGTDADGSVVPNVALFCANATPPSGDGPALLTHDEVTTLFHEFGHLLHHMLSSVEVRSLAGTNVAWDFVELPSQIHENWAWEREALDLFARHVETGAPIPDALLEKMRRARTFRGASQQMRQLGFASLDLALHRRFDPAAALLDQARALMAPFAPTPLPERFAMITSFSHLFSSSVGYAAGYYSYKWAEVLDADAFSRFLERGIFDPETGKAFRETVLSRGDAEDPMALFVKFMGREPALEPLLLRTGIPVAVA